MKLQMKIAMVLGALALATAPAMALASQPTNPGQGNGNSNGPKYTPETSVPKTPGPGASLPEKAKAYGRYCQGESKEHVVGEKGTAFSRCVTTMAKAVTNKELSPGQVCKGKSKKHVKGEKGTEFSRCVTAAAKLRKAQQE